MSSAVAHGTAAPANGGVANADRLGLEAGANNTRGERKAGKGRRRRAAAEQRRIEQRRWGQYVDDEEEDFSVVAPSPPTNPRRRARRSLRRNSARDDLEEYLNGLANDDHVTGLDDDLDLDVALALSFSIAEQNVVPQGGSSLVPVMTDMTYESLVQLENVRCVASATIVAALPVCSFNKEQRAGIEQQQALEVCVVCQGEYERGDAQVKLPCQHGFHQACGAEWLLNYSKLCPVCKHDVTGGN